MALSQLQAEKNVVQVVYKSEPDKSIRCIDLIKYFLLLEVSELFISIESMWVTLF